MNDELVEEHGDVRVIRRDGRVLYTFVSAPDFISCVKAILRDPDIEEIMQNNPDVPLGVFHKRHGMLGTDRTYQDQDLRDFIWQVSSQNSKPIDAIHPLFDGVLWDGSRVNISIPPVTSHISITIRKSSGSIIPLQEMIRQSVLPVDAAAFLKTVVSGPLPPANLLIVGGTASGKTTFLSSLLHMVGNTERIILIEDTPEIIVGQPNHVRMVAQGGITMDALLKNSLRMRPDRIIVGEVRGPEALTLFSAMNTGQKGCMGTLHANSARECVSRINNPPMSVPLSMMSSLDLVVVLEKDHSGARHVAEISEVAGADEDALRFNTLFSSKNDRKECLPTHIPSRLLSRISRDSGLSLSEVNGVIEKEKQDLLTQIGLLN